MAGGTSLPVGGLNIPAYDFLRNTYNGAGNLTRVDYYRGGETGQLVATVLMTYDNLGNVLTITRD